MFVYGSLMHIDTSNALQIMALENNVIPLVLVHSWSICFVVTSTERNVKTFMYIAGL